MLDEEVIEDTEAGKAFLKSLPWWIAEPEWSKDDNGNINYDWIQDKNNCVSAEVCDDGMIAWAYVFGESHGHGVCRYRDVILTTALEMMYDPEDGEDCGGEDVV